MITLLLLVAIVIILAVLMAVVYIGIAALPVTLVIIALIAGDVFIVKWIIKQFKKEKKKE